jgi:hypothetical protein
MKAGSNSGTCIPTTEQHIPAALPPSRRHKKSAAALLGLKPSITRQSPAFEQLEQEVHNYFHFNMILLPEDTTPLNFWQVCYVMLNVL